MVKLTIESHRDAVREEPVQVCLGDDEAVLPLGLARHLLLPQPLRLLARHRPAPPPARRRSWRTAQTT